MGNAQKNINERLKHWLFGLILLLLVLPSLQARFNLIGETPLTGSFLATDKPDPGLFTRSEWLSGVFQEDFNNRTENNIGFRNSLVRINNQLDFSFFRQANAEGVIVGKNGELFEEDYIREARGIYFTGDKTWQKKAAQLRAVQDTLRKMGKTLAVILEPGKATFYPDLLPRKYRSVPESPSNYGQMLHHFGAQGINVLDLDEFFRTKRNSATYPLFPKGGTHWSYYGAVLAADTTLSYLSGLSGFSLPDLKIDEIKELDTIRHPDYDIGLAMNLIFPILQPDLGYPVFSFSGNNAGKRPDALIVGDSFYFNWLNDQITPSAFGNCDFWYYNNNITRCDYVQDGKASEKNFREEIMKRDIILIMITGRFHHAFAWNFDEQLYQLFFPGDENPEWFFENQIRVYDAGFKKLVDEAIAMNISTEQRISQEAEYLFYKDAKDNPDKYTRRSDLVKLGILSIKNTPEWMEKIREKARNNNISEEEQLRRDAEWMADEKIRSRNQQL